MYLEAKERLEELGYPVGKKKWEAFWMGHRARCRGQPITDCPWPEPEEPGARYPYRRTAWLHGYGMPPD